MLHKIRVSAIQRLCVQDGPGVRTTVFLKGCYLACPWCCNPETIHYDQNLYFEKNSQLCGSSKICKRCVVYGGCQPKEHCLLGAYEKTYVDYEVNVLLSLIERDMSLFKKGGGVTISGGEPLMQASQLYPLLTILRQRGVNIAIETSLYAPHTNFDLLKDLVDYWLVDVKFQFGFISYIEKDKYKKDFELNLNFIQEQRQNNCLYRMVLSQQALPHTEAILKRLLKYQIPSLEILACHQLAANKYKQLGLSVPLFSSPSDEELKRFSKYINDKGIKTTILNL